MAEQSKLCLMYTHWITSTRTQCEKVLMLWLRTVYTHDLNDYIQREYNNDDTQVLVGGWIFIST